MYEEITAQYNMMVGNLETGEASPNEAITLNNTIALEQMRLLLEAKTDLDKMYLELNTFGAAYSGLKAEILTTLKLYMLELRNLLDNNTSRDEENNIIVGTKFDLITEMTKITSTAGIPIPNGTLEAIGTALEELQTDAKITKERIAFLNMLNVAKQYTDILQKFTPSTSFWNEFVAAQVTLFVLHSFARFSVEAFHNLTIQGNNTAWTVKSLKSIA